jgi:hypothetical protein
MLKQSLHIDAVGCCALIHAFMRNPEKVRAMKSEIGPLRLFADIFTNTRNNTRNITFQPNVDQVMIYRALATVELRRLQKIHDAPRFQCRHQIVEHCDALRALLGQFPKGH